MCYYDQYFYKIETRGISGRTFTNLSTWANVVFRYYPYLSTLDSSLNHVKQGNGSISAMLLVEIID